MTELINRLILEHCPDMLTNDSQIVEKVEIIACELVENNISMLVELASMCELEKNVVADSSDDEEMLRFINGTL